MARREGQSLVAQFMKCLHFTGKHYHSVRGIPVEHGTYTHRIPGSIILICFSIVEYAYEFCIQTTGGFFNTQFHEHGNDHLAIALRLKFIYVFIGCFQWHIIVYFSIGYQMDVPVYQGLVPVIRGIDDL